MLLLHELLLLLLLLLLLYELLLLLVEMHGSLIVLKDGCIEVLLELVPILAVHNNSILRLTNFLRRLSDDATRELELLLSCLGSNDILGINMVVLATLWCCQIYMTLKVINYFEHT